MGNKVEILIEVDPTGKGAAAIKSVEARIDRLGNTTKGAGQAGREALDGFAGGLGIPTSIAASTAAIAAGTVLIGKASIEQYLALSNAQRVLRSDTQSAGLEFQKTSADAKKLGDDLAISLRDADLTYGKFLRVVKAAGLTDDLPKLTQRFKDLTAAYGLTGTEIETLTSQLLNGQDEALNKLGIADPSQLYKAYAANVGKTVDALTQEEQARARLLAVTEKGAQFAGVAAERLNSDVGQWAQLSKYITDSAAALGEFLNKKTIVGDIPFILQNGFNVYAYQEKLEKESRARTEAARAKALADSDAYFKKLKDSSNVPAALKNPFGSFDNRVTLLGREQAEKERAGFVAQYDALFKDKRLDKSTALFAERQFNTIRGIFDFKKAGEIEAEFTKFWDKYAKVALGALKTARDAAEKMFSSIAERNAGGDNPFVKIFVDAVERGKELEKTFGVLGKKAVDELKKIEAGYTRQKLLALGLDTQLKANSLRREADNLARGGGISGQDNRRLDQLNTQISAAENIPALLAKAEAISKGLVKLQEGQYDEKGKRTSKDPLRYELASDPTAIQKQIFDELLRISPGDLRGEAGRKAADAINTALTTLFEGMSPELQARFASGQERGGGRFAEAFRGRAESYREAIRQEIENARVADRAVEAVRADMATILEARAKGLDSREADKRLLSVTGELAPGELSADLRQARIEALRREADRQANAEKEALEATKKATESTDKLIGSIDNLAAATRDPQNRSLLIEINNRADASVHKELYGSLVPD